MFVVSMLETGDEKYLTNDCDTFQISLTLVTRVHGVSGGNDVLAV